VVLGRKLDDLRLEDDKFVKRRDEGHKRVFYLISPTKEQKIRGLLKKQNIVSLLGLATDEETSVITDFLFKSIRTRGAVVSDKDALDLALLLERLKLRKKVIDLKRLGAPAAIIDVGERKVKSEETKLSFSESLTFETYPVNREEAKNYFLLSDFKSSKKGDSWFDRIEEENKAFALILAARYKELLGYNPFTR
jgi:hypothetical protein